MKRRMTYEMKVRYLQEHPEIARFNVVYVRRQGRYLYVGQAKDILARYPREEDFKNILYSLEVKDPTERTTLERGLIRALQKAGYPIWNKHHANGGE